MEKLCIFAEGLFFSLLLLYQSVQCPGTYDEQEGKSKAFRNEDNMQLQVLVSKGLHSLTGPDRDAPASLLRSQGGQLSVHQRTALFTLTWVHKALGARGPEIYFCPKPRLYEH